MRWWPRRTGAGSAASPRAAPRAPGDARARRRVPAVRVPRRSRTPWRPRRSRSPRQPCQPRQPRQPRRRASHAAGRRRSQPPPAADVASVANGHASAVQGASSRPVPARPQLRPGFEVALVRAPANVGQAQRSKGRNLLRRTELEVAQRKRMRQPAAFEVDEHADAQVVDPGVLVRRVFFHRPVPVGGRHLRGQAVCPPLRHVGAPT